MSRANDSTINDHVMNSYNISFILSGKIDVAGDDIHPLYKWLTTKANNGVLSNAVSTDFQKYLVNGKGKLIGVFSASVDPMSKELQDAIKDVQ